MDAVRHGPAEQLLPLFEALQAHLDTQLTALETQLTALHKAQEVSRTTIQRTVQDVQRGLDVRLGQMDQALVQMRQDLPRRQERRLGPLLGAYVGGALIGILLLAALWLGLGQTMRVHVLPQPPVNGQQKGQ